MGIQPEFQFTLPQGYVDKNGTLHRTGIMRLATAADEVLPLKDTHRRNPGSPSITVLSRVIVKLGKLPVVDTKVLEGLYASDLAYLNYSTTK